MDKPNNSIEKQRKQLQGIVKICQFCYGEIFDKNFRVLCKCDSPLIFHKKCNERMLVTQVESEINCFSCGIVLIPKKIRYRKLFYNIRYHPNFNKICEKVSFIFKISTYFKKELKSFLISVFILSVFPNTIVMPYPIEDTILKDVFFNYKAFGIGIHRLLVLFILFTMFIVDYSSWNNLLLSLISVYFKGRLNSNMVAMFTFSFLIRVYLESDYYNNKYIKDPGTNHFKNNIILCGCNSKFCFKFTQEVTSRIDYYISVLNIILYSYFVSFFSNIANYIFFSIKFPDQKYIKPDILKIMETVDGQLYLNIFIFIAYLFFKIYETFSFRNKIFSYYGPLA